MDELDFISIKKIEEIIKKAKQNNVKEVPMSFVVSLFPNAYENLKANMAKEYIRGFKDGKASVLEDDYK